MMLVLAFVYPQQVAKAKHQIAQYASWWETQAFNAVRGWR